MGKSGHSFCGNMLEDTSSSWLKGVFSRFSKVVDAFHS